MKWPKKVRMIAPRCPGIDGKWITLGENFNGTIMFYDRHEPVFISPPPGLEIFGSAPTVRTAELRWAQPLGWRVGFPVLVDTRMTDGDLSIYLHAMFGFGAERCTTSAWVSSDLLKRYRSGEAW